MKRISSASDDGSYPAFCAIAAKDEDVFSSFRSAALYQKVLEHFTYDDGVKFIQEISDCEPSLLEKIENFLVNDMHGGVRVHNYGKFGNVSPSTLRYVCHLAHLMIHFPNLEAANIVEIGGGYGGLCSVILNHVKVTSYTLVDLPEAILLQDRWLSKTLKPEQRNKIFFWDAMSGEQSPIDKYDLLISNYALTECAPYVQDLYLEKIVKRSNGGFIHYNLRLESYHPVELISKLESLVSSPITRFNESPPTCPTNFLLVYGGVRVGDGRYPPYLLQRALYFISPSIWYIMKGVIANIKRISNSLSE